MTGYNLAHTLRSHATRQVREIPLIAVAEAFGVRSRRAGARSRLPPACFEDGAFLAAQSPATARPEVASNAAALRDLHV